MRNDLDPRKWSFYKRQPCYKYSSNLRLVSAIIFEIGYRGDKMLKQLPDCAPVEEVINSILDQLCAGKDVVNVDCIVALHEALKEGEQ